jgi:hypothetical protein
MSAVAAIPAVHTLLAAFEAAAGKAGKTEAALRKQMEAEILRLERERAFAYRRLNFMRALADGIHSAKDEEAAAARGRSLARAELGWENDSEMRVEVLSRLTPVIGAAYACLASKDAETHPDDVVKALAEFEAWYLGRFDQPFWMLFEQHIEELPLVER